MKFLTIFATNLDEFFMIRVSGLRRQVVAATGGAAPDGMTPSEQILVINRELNAHSSRYNICWKEDILPALRDAGIRVLHYTELTPEEREAIQQYFQREISPVLTPLAFDPTHPFPHISNLSFNLAVLVKHPERGDCFARVKVPDVLPRLLQIPSRDNKQALRFVWLEDLIKENLGMLSGRSIPTARATGN